MPMSWDWLYGPQGMIYVPPAWRSDDSLRAHPEHTRVCSQMAQENYTALGIFALLLILATIGVAQMFTGLTRSTRSVPGPLTDLPMSAPLSAHLAMPSPQMFSMATPTLRQTQTLMPPRPGDGVVRAVSCRTETGNGGAAQ